MEADQDAVARADLEVSELPGNVMEYVAAVAEIPAGRFYGKVSIETRCATAAMFAAPFFALSALAPELLDKPTATVVLGGNVRELTAEGGRWLTLFSRVFQPACKLAFSICSPGRTAGLNRIKALFIQPPQKILKRQWPELLSEDGEAPDAVLVYGPSAYNDIWNLVMSGVLDSASRRCAVLWAGPSEADLLILCAMLRARHFSVSDPVPFCDSLADQSPPIRDGAWWIRISDSGSEKLRGLSREEGMSFYSCFSGYRRFIDLAKDEQSALGVADSFGTSADVVVDGQPVKAILATPVFGMERTTGRIFHRNDEQALSWQGSKVALEVLNLEPEDDPSRTPGENRYQRMAWVSRALDEGMDAAVIYGPVDDRLSDRQESEVSVDATVPATVPIAASIPETETALQTPAQVVRFRKRGRLPRGAGLSNVLAVTARLGRPDSEPAKSFAQARQEIATWLSSKGFAIDLQRNSFTLESAAGEVSIESNGDTLWSMRFDDRSQMANGAFWRVETTLLSGDDIAAIGLRVVQVRQSELAPAPLPGVPRVVASIADKIGLHEAGVPLRSSAWRANIPAEIKQLFALLENQERLQPVIVISATGDSSADVSGDRLASRLAGVAHVVCIGRGAATALIDHFGRSRATYGNAVRLYQPGFNRQADPLKHPLWTFDELPLPMRIVNELAEEACIIGVQSDDLEERVPSFQQVRNVIADARMRDALQQTLELASSAEEERLRQQTVRHEIEGQLQNYKADNQELRDTNRRLHSEREAVLAERDTALDEVRRLNYQLKALLSPGNADSTAEEDDRQPYPDTWDDLEAWVECYGNDRLVLLPQAAKAARKSAFIDIPFAYRVLEFLVEHYVPLRTRKQDDDETRLSYEAALAALGAEISPVGTAADQKLYKQEYRRRYEDKEIKLDLHVKWGVGFDPTTVFRLYFWYDIANERVVVGHFPSHLTNRVSHSG